MTFVVAVLGADGCGKTSFIKRFKTGEFYPKQVDTESKSIIDKIETNHGTFDVEIKEINDGDQAFPSLLENIDAAIIMFDLTSQNSYLNSNYWKTLVEKYNKNVKVVLCGNKYDLNNKDVETIDMHIQWNASYYNLSVKNCYNFYKPIIHLLKSLTGHKDLKFVF